MGEAKRRRMRGLGPRPRRTDGDAIGDAQPVIEVTPTDTHLHVEMGSQAETRSARDVAQALFGVELEPLTAALLTTVRLTSRVPAHWLDSGLRLGALYCPARDSLWFEPGTIAVQ